MAMNEWENDDSDILRVLYTDMSFLRISLEILWITCKKFSN